LIEYRVSTQEVFSAQVFAPRARSDFRLLDLMHAIS